MENILASKIIFRKNNHYARDIFDMVIALHKNPKMLHQLLITDKIEIEDLVGLRQSLLRLDSTRYLDQIKMKAPKPQYQEIAIHAPNLLLESINSTISR